MTSTESSARAAAPPTVKKFVRVAAPREIAFRVFTEKMSAWWPLATHHIGKAPAKEAVVEPRAGGRWFERGEDGSECDWGRVLVWDPPGRLVLTWEISATWQHDASLVTEVEVRFLAEDAGHTRVELEHRHLDRYGDKTDQMRATFESPGGWTGLLDAFARHVAAGAQG